MEERVASPREADERVRMRERLLTLLAERSYHYRPEKPRMALFTRTDLDRRVLGDRGGARPA